MKYTDLIELSDSNFKQLVGVSRDTFDKMVFEVIGLQPTSKHK